MAQDYVSLTDDNKLRKKILKEGRGTENPTEGKKAKVHYVGKLEDGTKFDSSRDRNSPFEFTIGQGVIEGWSKGVATMKKGEVSMFEIAHEYGYGVDGSPPTIPPRATLYFEIELLNWDSGEKAEVKIKKGVEAKAQGNESFKGGKVEEALSHYYEAEAAVEFQSGFTEEEQKTVDELNVSIFGNISAMLLKLGKNEDAVLYCSKVLDYDGKNVKAYFRRAAAYEKQKMFDQARDDLDRALIHHPDNKSVKVALNRVKKSIAKRNAAYKKKQQQLYANMFEKVDLGVKEEKKEEKKEDGETPETTEESNDMKDEEVKQEN